MLKMLGVLEQLLRLAFFGLNAETAFATGDNLTQKLWSAKLFKEAIKDIYFSKMTGESDSSVIQVKTDLTKAKGDRIRFGLRMRLTGRGVTGSTSLEDNEEALTFYDFDVTVDSLGNAVKAQDKMSLQRPAFDLRGEFKDALKDWLTEIIDIETIEALSASPTANMILYGGDATTDATLDAADVFSSTLISKMKRKAKLATPKVRGINIAGKDTYVCLAHPYQIKSLRAETAWLNAMRDAGVRGNQNVLFSGADSYWDGVIGKAITINKAMCGNPLQSSDYRKVKTSEIKAIRREDFDSQLAWLAGFIDGEGNINVNFYNNGAYSRDGKGWKVFRIEITITNTHADAIEKATKIIAKLGCFFKIDIRKRDTAWRPCFVVIVSGQRNAVKLIRAIEPHLTCKKELAKQAIYAFEYRQTLRKAGNNRFSKKNPRLQDNIVLTTMCNRAKELVKFRPDPFAYTHIASKPIRVKKPSETIRLTALSADDIVRTFKQLEEFSK